MANTSTELAAAALGARVFLAEVLGVACKAAASPQNADAADVRRKLSSVAAVSEVMRPPRGPTCCPVSAQRINVTLGSGRMNRT